jgi:hypothetical protein
MADSNVEKLLHGEQAVLTQAPCQIFVQGRSYNVRQVSNTVRRKISILEKEAYVLEQEGKTGVPLKRAKKIDKKIRTLHSKTAAYYLLGNWALFIPGLFWLKWHMLDLKDNEVTYAINSVGTVSKDVDFFLANWQITKQALALSTRLVGEGIKQYAERMESAANMLEEDALGVKEENK